MSADDVRRIVAEAVKTTKEELKEKAVVGEVLKRLFAPGGGLDQKPVERAEVARITKELFSQT